MNVEDMSKLDGRRLIKESGDLFLNDYYQSFLPGFTDLIKHSKDRRWYKDPVKHYGLQIALLETLQGLEQVSSEGKKLAREQSSDALAMQSKRNKFLAKAVKEIADGVAWRTLGFSRFKMRILSQGRYSGHTWGKDGQNAELKRAIRIVGRGGYVLVNDVTNCLRIGDLILIRPDKRDDCYLVEVKKKEIVTPGSILKKMQDGKALDKQEKRLWQAQIAIEESKFPASVGRIPAAPIEVPILDVVSSVGAVAKQAIKRGAAWRMVTPYMRIEVMDLPTLAARDDYMDIVDSMEQPEATQLFGHSNYDHLLANSTGEVERSSPPYTIFPLPIEVIAKMITGEMLVTCSLYREPLEEAIRALGWELIIDERAAEAYEPLTEAETVAEMSSELLFPRSDEIMPGAMVLYHRPSGFKMHAFELVVQMAREYLTVRHIVAVAEQVRSRAVKGQAAYFYPDVKDARRWN